MSDVTDLFSGKLSPAAFVEKEWANAEHLVTNLPAEIQPAAQVVLDDAKVVLNDAAEWAGTAISAAVSTYGANLGTEVLNVLSGVLGKTDPTSAAAQDAIQAVTKLLQGVVTNAVMSYVNASSPPKPQ